MHYLMLKLINGNQNKTLIITIQETPPAHGILWFTFLMVIFKTNFICIVQLALTELH